MPILDSTEETTEFLLRRVRAGDAPARERLIARFLPLLRRWAHGRLPALARDLTDTDDLVQVTLVRVLKQAERLNTAVPAAFWPICAAPCSTCCATRSGAAAGAANRSNLASLWPMAVLRRWSRQSVANASNVNEMALEALAPRNRELVIMRLEFDMTYEDIAIEVQSTPDAVRMAIRRAVAALAATLGESP